MQVTHDVTLLARWMAADLFLREVEVLRFEVRAKPHSVPMLLAAVKGTFP